MREDRLRWDQKYAEGVAGLEGPPIAYLAAWLPFLPRGRALDLAAGCGRHALHLARHGFRVDALDISPVGLGRLGERARILGVPVRAAVVDLDELVLPDATYALIVNTYYLNRSVLAQVPRALAPGGALLVETPVYDPAADAPDEVAHRVCSGELVRMFAGLDIAHYEEMPAHAPCRKRGLCRMVAFRPMVARCPVPAREEG